jgi:hypothetical protein
VEVGDDVRLGQQQMAGPCSAFLRTTITSWEALVSDLRSFRTPQLIDNTATCGCRNGDPRDAVSYLRQSPTRAGRPALLGTHATIPPVRRLSKRPEGEDTLRDAAAMQRTMNRLRGGALIPRGVYRFANHQEADAWMIRTIADTHAHLSSKTSSRSAKH